MRGICQVGGQAQQAAEYKRIRGNSAGRQCLQVQCVRHSHTDLQNHCKGYFNINNIRTDNNLQAFLMHVARMSDDRFPKQLLFGELTTGTRTVGRPLLRWKTSLKDTLKQSNNSTRQWQDTATDRSTWRRSIHGGLVLYDDSQRARRQQARNATSSASQDAYMCRHCGRRCSSRIGIISHERACNKQRGRDT